MPEKTLNSSVQEFSEGNVKGKLVIENNKGAIEVNWNLGIPSDQLKQAINESAEEASKQIRCACYIIEAKEILQNLVSGINGNENYTSLKFEISFKAFKYKDTIYAMEELLPLFVKEFLSAVNKIEIENEDYQQKLEQTPGGKSIEEKKKEEEEKQALEEKKKQEEEQQQQQQYGQEQYPWS